MARGDSKRIQKLIFLQGAVTGTLFYLFPYTAVRAFYFDSFCCGLKGYPLHHYLPSYLPYLSENPKSPLALLFLSSASFPLFQLEILLKYLVNRAIPSTRSDPQ
jgi:hypothetical protein